MHDKILGKYLLNNDPQPVALQFLDRKNQSGVNTSRKLKMMEPPEPYDHSRAGDILAFCGNSSRPRNCATFKLDRLHNSVLCTLVPGQISMSICTLKKWLMLLCLLLGSTWPHMSTALKVIDTSWAGAGRSCNMRF